MKTMFDLCQKQGLKEIGLLPDGCKVMQCTTCGRKYETHFKIYGCKKEEAI